MKRLIPFILALLLCVGCTDQTETEPPEPDEPRLDVTEAYRDFDSVADLITDNLSGREFLFYGRFKYGGGLIELSQSEPTEPEPVRYELTDAERSLVCEVVMAESGNQSYLGMCMVAFCILNDCERSGIRPAEAIVEYQYTTNRVSPNESVCEAVAAVFDRGEEPIMDKPLWFYAYKKTESEFHESQRPVCIVGDHAFFGEWEG